ncbi:MAG: hypothetical protein H5T44_06010 [Thermoplasmatales archaeon]|nr:hypothetical protein [Thermoplasmatales archaeon]
MFVLLIMLIFAFTNCASAHIFRITSNKTIYAPGDEIVVNLEIKNTLNYNKRMDIYVTAEEENDKYPPFSTYYHITLSSSESRNITIYTTNVSEFMVNGNYTVHAKLIDDGFVIYGDRLTFSIVGLLEKMDINILISNSSEFTFLKDVFLVNEPIYIAYPSSVDDLEIICAITYPDGSSKTINLPYTFISNKVGLYSLSINGRKEGYRNVTKICNSLL